MSCWRKTERPPTLSPVARMYSYSTRIAACLLLASLGVAALGQRARKAASKTTVTKAVESAADRALASRFAPVIHPTLETGAETLTAAALAWLAV